MLYSIDFADDAVLGLQVAPHRRDDEGLCRGLIVAGFGRLPVDGVALGDEVRAVNGIPLSDFGSEAALGVLSRGTKRRVTFRCRGKAPPEGGARPAEDAAAGDAPPAPAMDAVFDADAARDRSGENCRDTYLAQFADGTVGMSLLPAADGPRCGGLVVDDVGTNSAAPSGLRRGDAITTVNDVPLQLFDFKEALAIFTAAPRRRCRVKRPAAPRRAAPPRRDPSSTDDTDRGDAPLLPSPSARARREERSARRSATASARRKREGRKTPADAAPDSSSTLRSMRALSPRDAPAAAPAAADESEPTTTGPSEPTTLPVPGDTPRHSVRRSARRSRALPAPEGPSSDISASPRPRGASPRGSPEPPPRPIDFGDARSPPRFRGAAFPPPAPHSPRGRVHGWHLVGQKLIDSLTANAAELDALDRDRRAPAAPLFRAAGPGPLFGGVPRPSPARYDPSDDLGAYYDLLSIPGGAEAASRVA